MEVKKFTSVDGIEYAYIERKEIKTANGIPYSYEGAANATVPDALLPQSAQPLAPAVKVVESK